MRRIAADFPGTLPCRDMNRRTRRLKARPERCSALRMLATSLLACFTLACVSQGFTAARDDIVVPVAGALPCHEGERIRFDMSFDDGAALGQSVDGKRAAFTGKRCERGETTSTLQGFRLGEPEIQYQGGGTDEREARIVDDPTTPGNRALQFWLRLANVRDMEGSPLKGRVQMNVYGNEGVRRVAMSVRMYLHPDFSLVLGYPGKMEWLTISEWWNNAGWTNEAYPFRISVNLAKEGNGTTGRLVFKAHAQALEATRRRWRHVVWEQTNRSFTVPVGKWMTLEYGFEEGGQKTGRFFMAATPEGGERAAVFDIRGYTHHPDDPAPDGLSHWNPIKLYTSAQLIDHVRGKGGALEILWDDLRIVACGDAESTGGQPCSL